MPFLSASDRAFAEAITRVGTSNPFLPERIEREREALGEAFTETERVWSKRADRDVERVNVQRLMDRVEPAARRLRNKLAGLPASARNAGLAGRANPTHDELILYENVAMYLIYHRYRMDFVEEVLRERGAGRSTERVAFWDRFAADASHYLQLPGVALPSGFEPAHLFACFYQIGRAFHHIFESIVGGSLPTAKLRANIWESIFTHDLRRYQRALYSRMGDVTTLVMGPSGTGKELVARAIGLSRYVPFDEKTRRFRSAYAASFLPINLSALSPTLIESELFGHKRGAFTGALADRAGYFETCTALGTVFLDEIGECDPSIQVKLLRVLQTRQFQRLGDTETRPFQGKIIAATNRDLARDIRAGGFRADFYYRLCADRIETPSLWAQIQDSPEELGNLVLHLARRAVGEEAESLARETLEFIERVLGFDYRWPGNIRELEQCVQNILIRREYRPAEIPALASASFDPRVATGGPRAGEPGDHGADPSAAGNRAPSAAAVELARELDAGQLSADAVLARYCTLVYARTRNLVETARRLGLDRRTVRARLDHGLLARLGESHGEGARG